MTVLSLPIQRIIFTDTGYQRGKVRHDISSLLSPGCVNFCGVLKASLDVSENAKLIEYPLFLHHGNSSMTECKKHS